MSDALLDAEFSGEKMSIEHFLLTTEAEENRIRDLRHDLHRHPETAFNEYRTTEVIRRFLSSMEHVDILNASLGLNGKTGVVAMIRGGQPGKTVALRADIDALQAEEGDIGKVCSETPGLAHLCGHDGHTACLCGAALRLHAHRHELPGNVLLIFQPAEETTRGARFLLDHGLFEKYPFQAVFGLHNRPEIPTGSVVVKPGPLMASKINFEIVVHGLGGHGSMPHQCVDPIVCAAAMVQNVLTVASRNVDPMQALVLSICSIHGGTPDNLIVDTVTMTGSMRYLDAQTGNRALTRLQTIVSSTAETFECTADFNMVERVPTVDNDSRLQDIAQQAAQDALGNDAIVPSPSALASEDFAEYMACAPGWFYWLGNRALNDESYPWHHKNFHLDDDMLPLGARLLASSAIRFLFQK